MTATTTAKEAYLKILDEATRVLANESFEDLSQGIKSWGYRPTIRVEGDAARQAACRLVRAALAYRYGVTSVYPEATPDERSVGRVQWRAVQSWDLAVEAKRPAHRRESVHDAVYYGRCLDDLGANDIPGTLSVSTDAKGKRPEAYLVTRVGKRGARYACRVYLDGYCGAERS